MNESRPMPCDIDAEQAVLEAMTLSRTAAEQILDLVRAEDFYRPAHQELFLLLAELVTSNSQHDAIALQAEMRRTGSRIDPLYLAELTDKVPSPANGGYYAKLVADTAVLRRLVEAGTRIAQYGYEGVGDVADLVERARKDMDAVDGPDRTTSEARVGELFMPMVEDLEAPDDDTGSVVLPYTDLEEKIGGLRPGQVCVVGARPSVGKTVVAADLARHAAMHQQVPTIIFSLEMTQRELMHRIVSAEAGINLSRVRTKSMTDDEWRRMAAVKQRFDEAPLWINDDFNIDVAHIRARLRHHARHNPMGLVVVDYLQLMEGAQRAESRQVEVARMARGLKKVASEYGVPVVLLSQLNRESTKRTDKKPQLADLRESGAIEQDSDIVLLLHRDDMHEEDSPRAGEIDLIVEKNRNGSRGTVTCAFQGHYSRVVDMAAGHYQEGNS